MVTRLRKALGQDDVANEYIRTIPKRGYFIGAEVRLEQPAEISPPEPQLAELSGATVQGWLRSHRAEPTAASVFIFLLSIVTVLGTYYRKPIAASFRQLTNDGLAKVGPVFRGGDSLYFREGSEGRSFLVSMPVEGGDITRVQPTDLDLWDIFDFRSRDSRFLIKVRQADGEVSLGIWSPTGDLTPIASGPISAAAWVSDEVIAYALGPKLRILNRRSGAVRTHPLPYPAGSLDWSAKKQILFLALVDHLTGMHHLWWMRGLGGTPQPVSGYPLGAQGGAWSSDGEMFAFQVQIETRIELWAMRTSPLPFMPNPAPWRIAGGPLDYDTPAISADETQLFSIGRAIRGELAVYDTAAEEFKSYLGGVNGLEADFSRDGQWVTYSSFPDRTVWKIRTGGTNRVQLTFPPLQAIQPHWSPDGRTIAFMGQGPDKHFRVYLVSAEGGTPVESNTLAGEQGVPTWSPDGRKIVFGDLLLVKPFDRMSLHVLDVGQNRVSEIPGSRGFWSPRWSPDGRYLLALTPDYHRLALFDYQARTWRTLLEDFNLDFATWVPDSTRIFLKRTHSPGGLQRASLCLLNIKTGVVEDVADLRTFTETDIPWYGVTPNGAPLALRGVKSEEVYSIALTR